ncbi:MAG: hypothetical protein O2957_08055 [Verrucomicrobia bacterium]|nr:hypothetical protein [Verrucomicrobiota bacterium]
MFPAEVFDLLHCPVSGTVVDDHDLKRYTDFYAGRDDRLQRGFDISFLVVAGDEQAKFKRLLLMIRQRLRPEGNDLFKMIHHGLNSL